MKNSYRRLLTVPALTAIILSGSTFGSVRASNTLLISDQATGEVSKLIPLGDRAPVRFDDDKPVKNETASGLNTTSFDTLVGTVSVNLPDDLAAGDTISGTVIAEPKGKTGDEQAKNQDELSGYVVEIAKQDTPSKKPAGNLIDFCKDPAKEEANHSVTMCGKWSIPNDVKKIPLVLKDREGKVVSRTEVTLVQKVAPVKPASPEYFTPGIGQAGKPVSVKGSFDGDYANTSTKIGNQTAKFLASSPRKVVVESPRGLNGLSEIETQFNGKTVAKCMYRSISVKLAADKLNLTKGEQTTLTATLAGLVGLLSPVSFQLSNKSPGTVSMAGGEMQTIDVNPADVNGDIFSTKRTLTGVSAGGFAINALVDPAKSIQGNGGCSSGMPAGPIPQPSPDRPNPQSPLDSGGNPRGNDGPAQPVPPMRGTFRVTLNGFTVNHVTNHGLLQRPDAVTFHPTVGRVNADGTRPIGVYSGDTNTIGMTPENRVRGGTSSSNGGFQNNDTFPTERPWQRTLPASGAPLTIPPTSYFEGEIVQRTNGVWITPNIWSVDGQSDLDLLGSYRRALGPVTLDAIARRVGQMISGTDGGNPLALTSYLRPGARMGINNTLTLDAGRMQDRPIGMDTMGGDGSRLRFGFRPQMLILTYDSADYISRTSFGFGIGIVPVRYVDVSQFGGDYTLYLQVERLDTAPPCAESMLGSVVSGTATLRTDNGSAPGPYRSDIHLTVDLTECRGSIRIATFPAITTAAFDIGGGRLNTTTVTQTSGGTGTFDPVTGRMTIPVTLHFRHSAEVDYPAIAGQSDMSLVLTTESPGGHRLGGGHFVLVASGTFVGGFLRNSAGSITVDGILSPSP